MPANARCLGALAAALALWLAPTQSAAVVIDDFTHGPLLLRSYSSPTFDATQEDLDPLHTIGGVRRWTRFYHNISQTDVSPDTYSQITVDPTEGVFDFRSVDSARQIRGYFNLSYGDAEAPLGVDLTDDGADRLRLRFRGEFSTPWVQVNLRAPRLDGTGVGTIAWGLLSPSVAIGSDPIFDLPFPEDHYGLDLTQVESVNLYVYRYFAGDYFKLDRIETAGPPLTGDYDRDGDVDLDDYDYWARNKPLYGRVFSTGELVANPSLKSRYLTVDGDGDGYLSAADYTVWRDAYAGSPTPPRAVPEPTALLATGVGLLFGAVCRGHGRRPA